MRIDADTLVRLRSVPLATVVRTQAMHDLFKVGKIETLAIHKRDRIDYECVKSRVDVAHLCELVFAVLFKRDFNVAVCVKKSVLYLGDIVFACAVNDEARYAC